MARMLPAPASNGQCVPSPTASSKIFDQGPTPLPLPDSSLSHSPLFHLPPMSEGGSSGSGGERQRRRRQCGRQGGMVESELDAARALAHLAGIVPQTSVASPPPEAAEATTGLSLELGKVGIGPSSSARPPPQGAASSSSSYGAARPKQVLTEAEKEAKRLRRVLANRESARQTILRRQAIRDDLARKVSDLSEENENMKMEKEMVMKEYLSLKETNKQLKEQVAKTARQSIAEARAAEAAGAAAQAEAMAASSPASQASFPVATLYSAAPPPVMPVPYVWGSWPQPPPPAAGPPGYEHAAGPSTRALCLPPCAWYYPMVHELRGTPGASVYAQPFREQLAEPAGGSGSRQGEDYEARTSMLTLDEAAEAEDDPCSLTLAIDTERKPAAERESSGQRQSSPYEEKAATAAEARRRRKELTRLKQSQHGSSRPGGAQ